MARKDTTLRLPRAKQGPRTRTRATKPVVAKTEAVAIETTDPWAEARAAAADKIDALTTADCMRLYSGKIHPNSLVMSIEAVPEVADFKHKFAGDVMFVMGVRISEGGSGSTANMVATAVGIYRDGYASVLHIHQVNWDTGERRRLPVLMPLSEAEARFQQNPYAMSVSLEGLGNVQIDRTSVTMQDVVDGFMLAHRGMKPDEIERRYSHPASGRIKAVLATLTPYTSETDGRNPEWHGWPDMPPYGVPKHKHGLPYTKKHAHEQHARGRYGSGEYLAAPEDYEEHKVNPNAETRETVELLDRALRSVNLPREAERLITAAMETLTIKRGKKYANERR